MSEAMHEWRGRFRGHYKVTEKKLVIQVIDSIILYVERLRCFSMHMRILRVKTFKMIPNTAMFQQLVKTASL